MDKAQIARELNAGCCSNTTEGFHEWGEDDIDFDPEWNGRTYCWGRFGDCELCCECQEIIDKYTSRSLLESGKLRKQVKGFAKELATPKERLNAT